MHLERDDQWVGFCQKRRYWIKKTEEKINLKNINEHLLTTIGDEFNNYESIICDPINVLGSKKMKLLKEVGEIF